MTDAHAHPRDLLRYLPGAEEERRETGTLCAASSWNREDFEYHERLAEKARKEGAPRVLSCFALHPQLSDDFLAGADSGAGLELLSLLAEQGRLDAVGEAGFDLYDEKFRAAEKIQERIFAFHLETALRFGLPMVLHARRAMHKIFPLAKDLKKLPALIFHSWPGTRVEGESLLRRGINAYFSFGAAVINRHRNTMLSAAFLPAERILLETDAPYQPPRGKTFSSWRDLRTVCGCIAALRKEAGSPCAEAEELEIRTTDNFTRAFSPGITK